LKNIRFLYIVSFKIFTVLALSLIACAAAAAPTAQRGSADLVLINGRILTVDAKDSEAEGLAVSAGKIMAVGSSREISALAGPHTRVLNLKGRTATPGLIDSHAHISSGGLRTLLWVDLSDAHSVTEIVKRVAARAAVLKPGEWVLGHGWDEGKLSELRYVYAADLDVVTPGNPVWLEHTTGHYGVANSVALKLAGITASTSDPPAGTIDRDVKGQPTGVLKEAALNLVDRLIPAPTPEQRETAILHMVEALHREGMTAFKDPDIGADDWAAYQSLAAAGRLDERVCVLWGGGTTLESVREVIARMSKLPKAPRMIGDRLMSCGVKLFMDGSGGARTGWVHQPWNKNSTGQDGQNVGYPSIEPAIYREQIRLLTSAGINVGTHAVGDRAIDWVVDSYAAALEEHPVRGLRHTIIHSNLPTPHAMAVMKTLEQRYDAGYPEVQPPFLWWLGDTYAGNYGPERSLHLIPLRSFQQSGVMWGGGSDYYVTPFAARYGLWASTARETLRGVYGRQPFGMAESVDVHAALRSYTASNARLLFLEDRVGTLEVGKDADIAVWDRDPYSVPPGSLKDLHCELTMIAGTVRYRASTSPIQLRGD
jgi:predicted amidohydrolase YtcJ